MTKYTLYIGLNDKETLTQKIDTEEAVEIVSNVFCGYADGCTIYRATGYYKNREGIDTIENTLKVEVFDIPEDRLHMACRVLKLMLNQESIVKQTEVVNSEFV